MLKTRLKWLLKSVLWFLLAVLLLVLVLVAALHTAPVQRVVTNKVENYLESTLQTEVGIGGFGIGIPRLFQLHDVFVNTPEGDTLAQLGHLRVDLDMWAILNNEIRIEGILLEDVYSRIITTDSSSNFQFILDAFAPVDTVQQAPTTNDTLATPWVINLNNSELELNNIDIYYQDDPTGLLLDVVLKKGVLATDSIDLESQQYILDQLYLKEAKVKVALSTVAPVVEDTTSAANLLAACEELLLDQVDFSLSMDSLEVHTVMPSLQLQALRAELGEEVNTSFAALSIRGGNLTYDTPIAPISKGFDPNHIALQQLNTEIKDLDFSANSLLATIASLEVNERSGLQLTQLSGQLAYDPAALVINDLQLNTAESTLEGEILRYGFPDSTATSSELDLTARTQGEIAISEVLLVLPDSLTAPWLVDNSRARISFTTDLSSKGEQLNIQQLKVVAPGIDVATRGELYHVLDVDRLGATLNLERFEVRPREALSLLPDDLLPAHIEWPQLIKAQGKVSYLNKNIEIDFQAREERAEVPLWTQFTLRGEVLEAADFKQAQLDVYIDTILLTRQSIQAYLPPASLPEGYQVPDYFEAKGSVAGSIDDVKVNLQLALPGQETYLRILGSVEEVLDTAAMAFDLEIVDFKMRTQDILPLLPDSLIPPDLNIPNLRIQNASVKGRLDDLVFDIPINTTNGDGQISGRYKTEDFALNLDLEGTELAELFKGAIRDTLIALELQPLRMQVQAQGQLSPTLKATVSTQLTEVQRGQLLDLEAAIAENDYEAQLAFSHPYLRGTGQGSYRLIDSIAHLQADLDIEKVDLKRWQLSDRPLQGTGRVSVNAVGLETDQLDGRVFLDNILLRGDGSTAYIDSMLILAKLDNGNNLVTIESDVLQGELSGYFEPVDVVAELMRFLQSYLDEEPFKGDPVVNGRLFDLDMRLTNPRPFVSGIIPGLTELSPFEFNLQYRDQTPALIFDLQLGQMTYNGISLQGMELRANGDDQQIALNGDWENITIGEDIVIGRTSVESKRINGGLNTTLTVFAEDKVRHRFSLNWQQKTEGQAISLEPTQLINFSEWTLPEDNVFLIKDSTLIVDNWSLSRNDRSIVIRDDQENNGVIVSFDDISLARFSRLLNSEEALLGGILNGEIYLDEVLRDLGVRANIQIQELAYYEQEMGNLKAEVSSRDNSNFELGISLRGAGNDLEVAGAYREGGVLDLQLDLDKLQLASIEPFSLGYLKESEGYLQGALALTGTINEPRVDGQLSFQQTALAISLLGSRYRLDDERIRFSGEDILFDDFTMLDENDNTATLNGRVEVKSLEDIRFDLQASMKDFLAVNSTEDDNELFYGYVRVDAEADISGTVEQPRLIVSATPSSESNLTYAYTVADQARIETTQGIITFAETYEWQEIVANERRDTVETGITGAYLETNLQVNEKLRIRVIVDPITQQEFSGRGNGALTFIQYPTGQQQMTGQIEMAGGTYDMVLEGLQNYTFGLEPGSQIAFTGNPTNPQFDLRITSTVKTSPLPLVESTMPNASTESGLRQRETFRVALDLNGDLDNMDIKADILYPEEGYGNRNLDIVDEALTTLRLDQSRVYTTAIMLITFKSFVIPLVDNGGNSQNNIVNGVAGAVGDALSQLVNSQLGFVDFDLGVENYQTSTGEQNYNLRLSLQKSFFNDRLVVSVDGVTNTAEDAGANDGTAQTYLDNVSVAYLLDDDGNLRIKLFNDRDRNEFVGGNTIRFGGRLVFSKDFGRFFWQKK